MSRKKAAVILTVILSLLVASFFTGRYSAFMASPFSVAPTIETPMCNAQICVETSDIQNTIAKIDTLAQNYGGCVTSSAPFTYGMQVRIGITLKVPRDKFLAAVQQIETYGRVLYEQTMDYNSSEQCTYFKDRLTVLRGQEQMLRLELLNNPSLTDEQRVGDQNWLVAIEGEMENLEQRMSCLQCGVQITTCGVELLTIVLIVEPKVNSSVSIFVVPVSPTLGMNVTISGGISPPHNATLTLRYTRPEGMTFVTTIRTESNGGFTYSFKPDAPGSWTFSVNFAGDLDRLSAQSNSVTVDVRVPGSSPVDEFFKSLRTIPIGVINVVAAILIIVLAVVLLFGLIETRSDLHVRPVAPASDVKRQQQMNKPSRSVKLRNIR